MRMSPVPILIFLVAGLLVSCHSKKEHDHDSGEAVTWPEMDAFHMTMGDSYHPFKDSAKLEQARKLASDLAADADKWAQSTIPSSVDAARIRPLLDKLNSAAHNFADEVKSGASDQQLGVSLTTLHNQFHELMEATQGEEHDKHD